ncbi:dnaJ homolog subfamily C member 17 isoform 1-T1 [Spinachia spinachia]
MLSVKPQQSPDSLMFAKYHSHKNNNVWRFCSIGLFLFLAARQWSVVTKQCTPHHPRSNFQPSDNTLALKLQCLKCSECVHSRGVRILGPRLPSSLVAVRSLVHRQRVFRGPDCVQVPPGPALVFSGHRGPSDCTKGPAHRPESNATLTECVRVFSLPVFVSDPGGERCSRSSVTPKLKLKWKCKKDDETNGGYSQDILFKLLQKYGDVSNVILSSKKRGSAVVEFATVRAAELAAKNEIGRSKNPLKISWLEGLPEAVAPVSQPGQFIHSQGAMSNERDYESVVMMRMRQAAERQKLIEQMQREDDEEAAGS